MKKVVGYESKDGSIHLTPGDAARRDFYIGIEKLLLAGDIGCHQPFARIVAEYLSKNVVFIGRLVSEYNKGIGCQDD